MDLNAFVGKLLEEQDGDVLREGIRVLSQALMETEVAGLIGAERHERTGEEVPGQRPLRPRAPRDRLPLVRGDRIGQRRGRMGRLGFGRPEREGPANRHAVAQSQPLQLRAKRREASATTPSMWKPALVAVRTCVSAIRHFSRNTIVSGIPAAARRSSSASHSAGRYRSIARGHGRPSANSAVETATWPFPILPKAPQY